MTREDFVDFAKISSIDASLYCFDELYKDDAFVMRYDRKKWVVYWCERGDAHGKKYFENESEALLGLKNLFKSVQDHQKNNT